MEIPSFSAIETEFIDRVHNVVWCNLATIDTRNPPPSRIELANLPGKSAYGTQKNPRKIGKKSAKISRVEILQTTHNHPEKCVAKSERNPPKSLALTPSNQVLHEPASEAARCP